MSAPESPRFLTVEECASLVRLSVPTIHRLIAQGAIPAVKIGTNVRVPVRWRDKLLAAAEEAVRTGEVEGGAAQ